jgi:quinol monooxygenase YgiN
MDGRQQVRVVVQINLEEGAGDREALAASIVAGSDKAAREPGCLQYTSYRSISAPDTVVVLELWDSLENYDRHWQSMVAEDPKAGWPGPDGEPRKVIEFYRHAVFELIDGAWQTTDVAGRCESIRWP